ncbi:MAG: right-handed parallel beta-helix repeat-containing protein [Casimicrobiaceae bacterium]
MKPNVFSLSVVSLVVGTWVAVAAPAAASQRTFVSGEGNDANPCSLTAPCRGLQAAVSAVDPSGDVIVLDSAGYGAIFISKSVSIIAPTGVYAGISVSSGDGIFVNGGLKVVLRGLTLNGNGTAGRGINSGSSGAELHVENCVISGFTAEGILLGSGSRAFIKDSFVRDTDTGIAIGGVSAAIDNVRAENNRIGMRVDRGATATIRNSVAAGNSDTGFFAFTGATAQSRLNLEDSMASNNGTGIEERFSIAMISNCVVTGNTVAGVAAIGGFVYSRQNNTVFDNLLNVDAFISPLPPV